MRNWIFSVQPTATVIVVSGVATVLLLCGADTQAPQEVRSSTDKPACIRMSEAPVLVVDPTLEQSIRFQKFKREWHSQREGMSWITEIAMCPAYQGIIGMGSSVIPLILGQLKSEGDDPDHWFWALRSLTGVNPVPDQHQGDIVKMSEAWMRWGVEQGYAG
jgi:hypothetical protein